MAMSSSCRIFLLLFPTIFLLLPISVAAFILERVTNSIILGQTTRDWRTGAYEIVLPGAGTSTSDINIPLDVNQGPTFAVVGVCALAYIVLALDLFGIWELRKVMGTAGHERMWCWIVIVGNILLVALSLGIFGYIGSVQDSEPSWNSINDLARDTGEFTKETYACEIDKLYPGQGWAGTACGTAKSTRFLLIPLAISALLVIVSVFLIIRSRGGVKWLLGGKGRYAGFASVYEMQPAGQYPPHNGQPMPQWTSQPYPQWPPQQVQYGQVQPVYVPQQWAGQQYQQMHVHVASQGQKPGTVVEQQQVDSR